MVIIPRYIQVTGKVLSFLLLFPHSYVLASMAFPVTVHLIQAPGRSIVHDLVEFTCL